MGTLSRARQLPLFPKEIDELFDRVPEVGRQADIRYFSTRAANVLNGPAATGMSFWSINPYVGCAFGCAYCYARFAHRYTMERYASANRMDESLRTEFDDMPPWLAFERRIFVKANAADKLARTLREGGDRYLPLVQGDSILLGSATDPYQPAERSYRLTRRILEVFADHPGLTLTIITKSPLITRDVDVLRRIMRHSTLRVHVSLITLDRDLARRIEPRAPTPDSRVRAVARLAAAGIDVGINCMPVLPGITDDPAALDALVQRVASVGVRRIAAGALRLDRTARLRYFPFLAEEFPELEARYRNSYARGRNIGEKYRAGLAAYMATLCAKYGLETRQRDDE